MLPTIDMINTGANIAALRKEKGLSIRDIQSALGFNTPQAIFKWQRGDSLPSLDNLVILAELLNVKMDEIVVIKR